MNEYWDEPIDMKFVFKSVGKAILIIFYIISFLLILEGLIYMPILVFTMILAHIFLILIVDVLCL